MDFLDEIILEQRILTGGFVEENSNFGEMEKIRQQRGLPEIPHSSKNIKPIQTGDVVVILDDREDEGIVQKIIDNVALVELTGLQKYDIFHIGLLRKK